MSFAAAAVPLDIQHQGRLFDNVGNPLSGSHVVAVELYGAPSGGSPVWSQSSNVAFDNGYFSLSLSALDVADFDADALYLSIALDGGPPLPSRLRLSSVPYALRADSATNVVGGVVDAAELRVNGVLVVDSSGAMVGEIIDPLASFSCTTGQTLSFDGSAWHCSTPASMSAADIIAAVESDTVNLAPGSQVGGRAMSTLTLSDVRNDLASNPANLASGTTVAGVPLSTLTTTGVRTDLAGSAVTLGTGSTVAGTPISTLTPTAVRVDLGSSPVALASGSSVGGANIVTSWSNLPGIPSDIADGDQTATEGQVETWITNGALNLASGTTLGGASIVTSWSNLPGIPSGIADGDDVLTEAQVEAYVSNGAINLAPGTNDRVGVGTTSPQVRLDVNGPVRLGDTSQSCDASLRGTLKFVSGGTGVGDTLVACMKAASGSYSWTTVQDYGGWFAGSVLMSSAQQSQVNNWIGTPNQSWNLCYRRSLHGASSTTFHSRCDNRGATVMVMQLNTGVTIGGYTPVAWNGSSGYRASTAAFLFSLTNNYKHANINSTYATYDTTSYGPTYGGGHDLYVNSAISGGYCNIGHSYSCRTGSYGSTTCQNDLCGNYSSWSVVEMEVWSIN